MTPPPIGGSLGMRELAALTGNYDQRAQRHRPTGSDLEAEIRRLRVDGLTAVDISVALRLPLDFVRNVLEAR